MLHLSADLKANYNRFIKRIKESGVVWGLRSEAGWANCPSNEYEDSEVFPFWSDEAYAKRHCIESWSEYSPAKIDFDSFIDNWLKGMNEEAVFTLHDKNIQLRFGANPVTQVIHSNGIAVRFIKYFSD